MPFTLDATAAALNRYHVTYASEVNKKFYQERVSEGAWSARRALHTYATQAFSGGPVLQAFQCPFTPNNDGNFTGAEYTLRKLKIDIEFTCEDLEMWFDKFYTEWTQWGENKSLTEWDFPRWYYNNHVRPQVAEDIELAISYNGVYVAPTAGVAGTPAGSVDGMGKVIADGIASGAIPAANVIATGPFTPATYYDQVTDFINGIDINYRSTPGIIYMSDVHARGFQADILEKFGNNGCCDSSVFNEGITNQLVNFTMPLSGKRVMGLPSMRGSDRMYFSPKKDNLIWGYRTGTDAMPTIRWREHEGRTLRGYAELYRFYGIEDPTKLFVNDQA